MTDYIDRQAAIDAIIKIYDSVGILGEKWAVDKCQMAIKDLPSAQPETSILTVTVNPDSEEIERVARKIKDAPVMVLPSAQPEPSEITDEQAILHLQSTGWMQNHDREMYESGLRERLADDSGSYDSLVPCDDTISRQAAIDAVYGAFRVKDIDDFVDYRDIAVEIIKVLPSAQPKQQWIPVNERLPKQGQEVICQCRARIIKVLKLDADGDWYQDASHCYMRGFVIAWMPLPMPPSREEGF